MRLITYDGTLAFDGASARWVHDHLVAVEDSTAFPADAGKITSLRWVHDHVAAFGGNPNAVTLLGQSAGAGARS